MNNKRPMYKKARCYKDYCKENMSQIKGSSYLPLTEKELRKWEEEQMIENLKKNPPFLKGETVSLS